LRWKDDDFAWYLPPIRKERIVSSGGADAIRITLIEVLREQDPNDYCCAGQVFFLCNFHPKAQSTNFSL
jgi:hypothetical protein